MRNFDNFNRYLDILMGDIYPQPPDLGHSNMAEQVIANWISMLIPCERVLDVGCGQGFAAPMFQRIGIQYMGVALGEDARICQANHLDVMNMDFHFLDFPDDFVDLVFARHSLEHSPMPLLALMEWKRVSKNWLCIILPNPEVYGWTGLNHYSVMHPNQVEFLLDLAGWHIIWTDFNEKSELRYMCEKKRATHYEAFIERETSVPIPS